jgi:hypothetical protein
MSAPVEVTFRSMAPRPELDAYARTQVAHLHRLHGRIIDCRVLLEPCDPGLRVVIELAVPGERLVASREIYPDGARTPGGDGPAIPEYRWLHALHEGFEAAGRLLQDYAGHRTAARGSRRAAHR